MRYSAGHFNPEPDADGITRKIPMLVKYGKRNYYDALSLAVARAYLQNPVMVARFAATGAGGDYAGLEAFEMAGKRIPVDAEVATLVPYRGVQGSFKYVSATRCVK